MSRKDRSVAFVKVALLLLAAGRGTRFGGPIAKVYQPLAGKSVLLRSAERLRHMLPDVSLCPLIVIIAADDRRGPLAPLAAALTALGARIVDGGTTRQQSMMLGLAAAGPCDLVLIHDAARPMFPIAATRECIARAAVTGAALLAMPATDTLKRLSAARQVAATVDRSNLWCAQTPQVIRRDLLEQALRHASANGLEATDDVGLIEAIGGAVDVVQGAMRNFKITHQEDLAIAEALWPLDPERP
ncbi:2-C-methyl-D-erythritol 4-phosphate cytidylyltransferase [Planctomycetota bacterium]|nr:2-C-methyl-D-erythritol 4-phosphate cytidylyltransferase [Planctomycetota bacterium]